MFKSEHFLYDPVYTNENDISNQQRSKKVRKRITYNCKEKRHCSLVLLHGCACYLQLLQCTENWLMTENYQTFSSTLLRLLEADTHLRTPLRIPFQNWD